MKNVGGSVFCQGQDSSVGGGAGVICLGVVHMEEGVQLRVQVEVRREEEGDKERHTEKVRTKKQRRTNAQPLTMDGMEMKWRTHADKFGGSSWAKRCDVHKNHEVWSAWEKWRVRCIFLQRTLRYSNFAKHFPNSNALIAIYDGRSALSIELVEDALKHRKELRMSTRAADVLSIPGLLFKKNNKRGARHGPSEPQRMFHKAREMWPKARQENHGSHSSILARWHTDSE